MSGGRQRGNGRGRAASARCDRPAPSSGARVVRAVGRSAVAARPSSSGRHPRRVGPGRRLRYQVAPFDRTPTEQPLPHATVGGLAGLLEILAALGGREDLPDLARLLTLEVDDLLPLVDASQLLA